MPQSVNSQCRCILGAAGLPRFCMKGMDRHHRMCSSASPNATCMAAAQIETVSGVACACPFCKADYTVVFRGPLTPAQRRSAHREEQLLIEAQLQAQAVRVDLGLTTLLACLP